MKPLGFERRFAMSRGSSKALATPAILGRWAWLTVDGDPRDSGRVELQFLMVKTGATGTEARGGRKTGERAVAALAMADRACGDHVVIVIMLL